MKSLLIGLAMGESPRWHDDRLWLSDWGAQEIIAANLAGESEVIVRPTFGLPFCIDWLPDGRLLIVSGRRASCCAGSLTGRLRPMPTCASSQPVSGTKSWSTVAETRTSMAVLASSG